MAEPFDPYHVWLGIPPGERPVNHYRLLGIEAFESNPEVIENAADQRMLLLRTFQVGRYSDLSQKMLNEVATAKVCLLRPEKKAVYDEQLRQQLQAKAEGSVNQRLEIDSGLVRAVELEARKGRSQTRQVPKPGRGLILGAAGAVGVLVVIVVAWAATRKAALPVVVAPERENRNMALAGTSAAPQPPAETPLSRSGRGAGGEGTSPPATQGSEPAGHKGTEESPRPSIPNRKSQLSDSQTPIPPPAVAPFDAEKAKQHQEAWAKYLGVPVNETNSIGMPLALIPAGEFMMGSTPEEVAWCDEKAKGDKWLVDDRIPAETPQHRVKISRPFYLGVYPVTQGECQQVVGDNPSSFCAKGKDASKVAGQDTSRHPVEMVSWDDAAEFCRRLSSLPNERRSGRTYRLPNEAEWEYACRAGTTTRWSCGDSGGKLLDRAWFKTNAGGTTHPVGQKMPNAWGLYDMHGNVSQWFGDWCGGSYYGKSPSIDPMGPAGGSMRGARGGNWSAPAICVRSSFRLNLRPDIHRDTLGFRVVAEINVPQAVVSAVRSAIGAPTGERGTGEMPVVSSTKSLSRGGRAQGVGEGEEKAPASRKVPSPPANPPQAGEGSSPALVPVPADDAREAAAKAAQETYRGDYDSAKSVIARQALAKRILDDALKAHDKPTERYALLCLAREVAVAGQDDKLAIEAIDELSRTFAIDAWTMKAEAMEHLAKGSRSTAARW
jgi:formylglycine-generating enzyme required for sulfatase activity